MTAQDEPSGSTMIWMSLDVTVTRWLVAFACMRSVIEQYLQPSVQIQS